MAPESSKSFHQLVFITEGAIKKRAEEYEIDPNLLGKIKVKVLNKEGKEEYEDQWLVCNMPIEEFIAERKDVAEKYRVPSLDLKYMKKKDGNWYIHELTPEKWLEKKIEEERKDDIETNSGWRRQ